MLKLSTGQRLPDLRILPAGELFLHEECDPDRVADLSARIRDDGVLRNPPVAAPLPGRGGFVVLDGANRTSALAALGLPAAPVQVVDYGSADVRLEVWQHYLPDVGDLAARLAAAGLTVRPAPAETAARRLAAGAIACYLSTADQTCEVASAGERDLAATLAAVVNAYKGTSQIFRVQDGDLAALARDYGAAGTLVVFPALAKADILRIARSAHKLPTGITRHIIPGRALRLNLPLSLLSLPGGIEDANRALEELIRQRLRQQRVRYYPEATVVFDE